MSAITGETTLLKSVRSRAVVLHDDSFVEDYPVVFVLMYGKQSLVVSRDLEVVPHGLDVISVINDHVLDRIKVDGQ
jgi:hypothetical protein